MRKNTKILWNDEGTLKKGVFVGKSSVPGKVYIELDDSPKAPDGEPITSLVMEKDVRKE